MEGGGTMLMDLEESKRLDEREIYPGVFITSNLLLRNFKGQLCARIRSRGRHVVNVVDSCRVVVVLISIEYLLSKWCMRELAAIVRSKRKMRIIPVFLGVRPKQWKSLRSVCLEEWHQWADASVTEKQEWSRALEELIPRDGLYFANYMEVNQVIDQTMIVDAVCKVVPDKYSTLKRLTGGQAPILETVLRIPDTLEEFRSQVVICSIQSECLITKIQELSSKILERILQASRGVSLAKSSSFYAGSHWTLISTELDRFLCIVAAAEDLLYLCAEEDWKLAALSVFLPASCAASDSKFSLVARDLDSTYHMLLLRLQGPIAYQPPFMSLSFDVANKQDRSTILHKLESGSVHRGMYVALLRKRLQEDASTSTPGLLPDWCWIPGKLEYSYVGCVASGSFKSVLKCQWLGLEVAIAVYKGEYAKNDLEAEAGILASVQHPNVVNLYACAYDDEEEAGYLVTEFMEQDLRQLIRKSARGHGQMPFSLSVSADIILQIVEAMIHLRECRVLHRDLKPANILVSAKKRIGQIEGRETYYVVKLIDFGSARVRGAEASTCHTRKQGTTAYMAPELHAKKEDCTYKWPADVYSFGMTTYEILTRKSPFEGDITSAEVVKRICAGERPSFPDCIPVFWKELIEKCWHRDPEHRPSFELIREKIMRCISEEHSEITRIENSRIEIELPRTHFVSEKRGIWSTLKSIFWLCSDKVCIGLNSFPHPHLPSPIPRLFRRPLRIYLSHAGGEDQGGRNFPDWLYDTMTSSWKLKLFIKVFLDRRCWLKGKQFPDQIEQALEKTEVGIVVVTPEFFTRKWPMTELVSFKKSQDYNRAVRILPLFYQMRPGQVRDCLRDGEWEVAWTEFSSHGEHPLVMEECRAAVRWLCDFRGVEYNFKDGGHDREYIKLILKGVGRIVREELWKR